MQLPVPSIPTDNLYKFLAVTGLICALACLLYPPIITVSMARKAADVVAARALIDIQIRDVESQIDDLSSDVHEAKTKESDVSEAEIASLDGQLTILKEEARTLEKGLSSFERDGRIAQAEGEALSTQMDLIASAFVPSIVLALFGFLMWYLRVQRYADAVLRLQAEALKNSTNRPLE